MKSLVRCLLPLSLLTALPAHANLTVHPMRTSVDAKKGAQIRIYSQSTQPQYVQASIKRIVDPAGAGEQEVEVEPNEAAIAITPGKFALAGGGNRLIRVIPLQPVEKETAYRVYFEGMRGPDGADPAGEGETAQANVGVSLVWGALVNVLPAQSTMDVQVEGSHLRNTGTLRVGVTSIADCDGARCTAHDVSRSLYPGSTLQLPFPVQPGHTLQLRYRLTRDGYREHVHNVAL
ncbi:pilus assembly protein [Stenotrophomonas sp. 3(2025)]|uniref:pilus assembly protein n=1 Tax=Stenotrophomonas sp. 3(2025) TaxID=3456023 RepID=UPI004043F275